MKKTLVLWRPLSYLFLFKSHQPPSIQFWQKYQYHISSLFTTLRTVFPNIGIIIHGSCETVRSTVAYWHDRQATRTTHFATHITYYTLNILHTRHTAHYTLHTTHLNDILLHILHATHYTLNIKILGSKVHTTHYTLHI